MNDQPPHELFSFMEQETAEMEAEYGRIRVRSTDDPGTAGDEGEGNWQNVLAQWLPVGYRVRTKGRLLSVDGRMSPQVDVIVLRPSYPRKMAEKKVYFADGVAAVFECKTTLKAQHIAEAVETASIVKNLVQPREGSPCQELRSQILFGLLAHSHAWKKPHSAPEKNITGSLIDADREYCRHPKDMLDLLCVSDLGTWSAMKTSGLGPNVLGKDWLATQMLYGYPPGGGVSTLFVGPRRFPGESGQPTPIGVMFAVLLNALAWDDPTLRPIADYFRLAGMYGSGEGRPRIWPWDVYSASVRRRAEAGQLNTDQPWDEWTLTLF